MPIPMMPVTREDWSRAPTLTRLVERPGSLFVRYETFPPATGIFARLRQITAKTAQVGRARDVIERILTQGNSILRSSTTRVIVDVSPEGPVVHLRTGTGAYAVVACYEDEGRQTYSVGYHDHGRSSDLLWTDEIAERDLGRRFSSLSDEGRRMELVLRLVPAGTPGFGC